MPCCWSCSSGSRFCCGLHSQAHRADIQTLPCRARHPCCSVRGTVTKLLPPRTANPAKDVETTQYPYAELFRDFAASICRPNAVVVTYGYGFGDDHIKRVLLDMLAIPSTHLVIIAHEADIRLTGFCEKTSDAQVSLLIGPHFADLATLVENYLPKPALDYITGRMTELMKHRPTSYPPGEAPAAPAVPSGAGDPS